MRYLLGLALPAAVVITPCFAQQQAPIRSVKAAPVVVPTNSTLPSTSGETTVIFTNVVTSPLSDVPGVPGAKFTSFDRPGISPNGLNYIIAADTDLPTIEDDVLLVNGAVVLRENDSPSYVDALDTINNFDMGVSINDAGQFAFGHTTDDAFTENDYIVRGDSLGAFALIAREGFQVVGAPLGFIAGAVSGSSITASGEVWYEVDGVQNTPLGTTDNNLTMAGTTILAQNGVTIPTGQAGGLMDAWQNFDSEDAIVSADGTQYILQGDTIGDIGEDDLVVVNGAVVIQEGHPLPGGPADLVDGSGIFNVFMHPSGSWMADGDFDVTNADWAVMNGTVIAMEGEPLHQGAIENWGTGSFTVITCNGVGDFVVGGGTDIGDFSRDQAIVINNDRVLLREGDPLDLDGNGLFDDDLFFAGFGADDFRLTDNGILFFTATLRTGTTLAASGAVFMTLDTNVGVGSSFCAAQPNSSGQASILSATGSSTLLDNLLTLHVEALPVGAFGFFVTSLEPNFVANPGGSTGDLCIASFTLGRYDAMAMAADMTGAVSLAIDLTATPFPSGPIAVAPGETRYWQFWHRDSDAMGVATSNFSRALSVTFQ